MERTTHFAQRVVGTLLAVRILWLIGIALVHTISDGFGVPAAPWKVLCREMLQALLTLNLGITAAPVRTGAAMYQRSTSLLAGHWAGKWEIPQEGKRNDLKAINQLGYSYRIAEDGPEKEALLLQIVEAFHGFTMKYLVMIVRGTIPAASTKPSKNSLTQEFLSWHSY